MSKQEITKDEAIALSKSRWWVGRPAKEVALFQLSTPLLCMDFGDYHEAVEKALGRPVWTHEFSNSKSLLKELLGEKTAPTFQEIMEIIPPDKRVIVMEKP